MISRHYSGTVLIPHEVLDRHMKREQGWSRQLAGQRPASRERYLRRARASSFMRQYLRPKLEAMFEDLKVNL
jgi:phage FluMu gp28-like protein